MSGPGEAEAEARSRLTEAAAIDEPWTRPELLAEATVYALLAAVGELRKIRRRT